MKSLPASVRIVASIVVIGAAAGVLWGLLAPAEQLLVVAPGRGADLTGESNHQFDAVAIFLCGGVLLGIAAPIGSWLWRSHRGPMMVLAVILGSLAGSAACAGVGSATAHFRNPHAVSPAVGSVVDVGPALATPLAVLVQPLVAAVVLVVLAALSPTDDLRSRRDDDVDSGTDDHEQVNSEV